MNWYLAKSLVKLRDELNAAFPDRSRISDGALGDLRHSKLKSDHNPNSAGVVTAIDVTNDTTPNELGGQKLADALYNSKDKRIKYLIFNHRITNKPFGTGWKPYHGTNAHEHHVHISVASDPKLYDDAGDWNLNFNAAPIPEPVSQPIAKPVLLQFGDKGDGVAAMQDKLARLGYMNGHSDGIFGKFTEKAVEMFQHDHDLRVDGKAGQNTLAALDQAFEGRIKK